MSYAPAGFDNVEVLRVPLGGGQVLYVACGVAIINFQGTGYDWQRDDLVFLVPDEGATSDLNVGNFQDSVVSAYPATIESLNGETVGWGIDTVDTITDGASHVEVTARTVVRNANGKMLRMGFQVNIIGS